MNKKFTALAVLALVLGMVSTVSADQTNSDNTVTANVTSTVALDVKPESLSYPGLEVGNLTDSSNRSFDGVSIANIGSEYIDRVWIESTEPNTRPFASGNPKAYNAGNFLVAKPQNQTGLAVRGDYDTFHFINRREFEGPSPPNFIEPADDGQLSNNVISGARFGDEWFFFDLMTTTDGSSPAEAVCSGGGGTSANLRIGKVSHTTEDLGTYDFTSDGGPDGIRWKEFDITSLNTGGYGITNSTVTFDFRAGSGTNQTYDILTGCKAAGFQENHIVLSKYNVNYNETSDLYTNGPGGTNYVFRASQTDTMLTPGDSFTVDLGMRVPRGVSAGQVTDGTLTVFAQSDNAAGPES